MVTMGAGDMAQMLRALMLLQRIWVQVPVPHGAYNLPQQGIQHPPLTSTALYIHAEITLSQNSSRPALELPNWFFRQVNSGLTLQIPIWVNIINYSWVLSEVCIANSWKTNIFKKVWRGLTLRLGVDNLFHRKPAVVWGWNDSTGSCVCTLSSQPVVLFWKIGELSGDGAFLQEGWALAFYSLTTLLPVHSLLLDIETWWPTASCSCYHGFQPCQLWLYVSLFKM